MEIEVRAIAFQDGSFKKVKIHIIDEVPLRILIKGSQYTINMCSPSEFRELATGILFTEGIIDSVSQIKNEPLVEINENSATIDLDVDLPEGFSKAVTGCRIAVSSCGICDSDTIPFQRARLKRIPFRQRFDLGVLLSLKEGVRPLQPIYRLTGGAHAAFVFDHTGEILLASEDMGRHNALDKVIGKALLLGLDLRDKGLFSTGRCSLEMVLKAIRAEVPIFVSISRPTSLALAYARYYNLTLVDLARDRHVIYTHARRIKGY